MVEGVSRKVWITSKFSKTEFDKLGRLCDGQVVVLNAGFGTRLHEGRLDTPKGLIGVLAASAGLFIVWLLGAIMSFLAIKKSRPLPCLTAIALFVSTTVFADLWIEMEGSEYLYDITSIKLLQDGTLRADLAYALRGEYLETAHVNSLREGSIEGYGNYRYTLAQFLFDCASRRYGIMEATDFSRKKEIINFYRVAPTMTSVKPGSSLEPTFNTVCESPQAKAH